MVSTEATAGADKTLLFTPVYTSRMRVQVQSHSQAASRIGAYNSLSPEMDAFSYDGAGNRLVHTRGGQSRHYDYAPGTHRLQAIRTGHAAGPVEASFTHDDEGRLTAQSGPAAKSLSWDAKGRLKSLNGERYRYDVSDHRIAREGGSLGSRQYFLEGEHLESEYSGSGELKARYFRGASVDELIAAYLQGPDGKQTPYLFHQDAITSTLAVSGHNGGALQRISYGAFGNVIGTTGSSPNRQRYTGREDDGTGLYYYRARYYDTATATGRFISEDRIGFAIDG